MGCVIETAKVEKKFAGLEAFETPRSYNFQMTDSLPMDQQYQYEYSQNLQDIMQNIQKDNKNLPGERKTYIDTRISSSYIQNQYQSRDKFFENQNEIQTNDPQAREASKLQLENEIEQKLKMLQIQNALLQNQIQSITIEKMNLEKQVQWMLQECQRISTQPSLQSTPTNKRQTQSIEEDQTKENSIQDFHNLRKYIVYLESQVKGLNQENYSGVKSRDQFQDSLQENEFFQDQFQRELKIEQKIIIEQLKEQIELLKFNDNLNMQQEKYYQQTIEQLKSELQRVLMDKHENPQLPSDIEEHKRKEQEQTQRIIGLEQKILEQEQYSTQKQQRIAESLNVQINEQQELIRVQEKELKQLKQENQNLHKEKENLFDLITSQQSYQAEIFNQSFEGQQENEKYQIFNQQEENSTLRENIEVQKEKYEKLKEKYIKIKKKQQDQFNHSQEVQKIYIKESLEKVNREHKKEIESIQEKNIALQKKVDQLSGLLLYQGKQTQDKIKSFQSPVKPAKDIKESSQSPLFRMTENSEDF